MAVNIGLIGVGLLGSAIAERLIAAGIAVQGTDPDFDRLRVLSGLGGTVATDTADLIRDHETIILSLPSSDIATSVLEQYRFAFRSGQTVIDTTTGDPLQMMAIEKTFAELGVHYCETLVAGSSDAVRNGEATLFVGGKIAVVESIQPILQTLAPKHVHIGPVGDGSRFKLVHNLVLGLNRAVLAEGLTFAESLGFDAAKALSIFRQTPAESRVMQTKGERMVTGDYTPQARLSQHLKDVRLILDEAARLGAQVPLSYAHQKLLERAEQLGFADADNCAVIEAFRGE